eukprot:TRINITY_DN12039_c0_g1_i3.p1 TRINITY_DN12039_c0_g1~~TRINITY_DN12039_c0_g1_i3.p1  ORF type:complete len:273 (-),score=80.81 TRINITY_DN12039_c0_g1_i3:11-829(-)
MDKEGRDYSLGQMEQIVKNLDTENLQRVNPEAYQRYQDNLRRQLDLDRRIQEQQDFGAQAKERILYQQMQVGDMNRLQKFNSQQNRQEYQSAMEQNRQNNRMRQGDYEDMLRKARDNDDYLAQLEEFERGMDEAGDEFDAFGVDDELEESPMRQKKKKRKDKERGKRDLDGRPARRTEGDEDEPKTLRLPPRSRQNGAASLNNMPPGWNMSPQMPPMPPGYPPYPDQYQMMNPGSNFTFGQPPPYPYGYPTCLLYTSPSPRDRQKSRMPSSA